MSEVKRYEANLFGVPMIYGAKVVMAEDFDQVTSERDALQALLTAADVRADVLEGLLRDWLNDFGRTHGGLQRLKERTRTALKPAEGGGDEA